MKIEHKNTDLEKMILSLEIAEEAAYQNLLTCRKMIEENDQYQTDLKKIEKKCIDSIAEIKSTRVKAKSLFVELSKIN